MSGDKYLTDNVDGVITEARALVVSAGIVSASRIIALGPNGQIDSTMLPASSAGYTFYQAVPATTWTIAHNLNRRPVISVADSAGTWCEGDVSFTDLNTVTLSFSVAFSGYAYLV